MPIVYMMIGLPASGKSTKAREIADDEGILIISHDDMRRQLFGRYDAFSQEENEKLYGAVKRKMGFYLKNGVSFIHDATNLKGHDRKRMIKFYKSYGAEVIGVIMMTPIENCIKRNKERDRCVPEQVIYDMAEYADFPLGSDGLDKLIKVSYKGGK